MFVRYSDVQIFCMHHKSYLNPSLGFSLTKETCDWLSLYILLKSIFNLHKGAN